MIFSADAFNYERNYEFFFFFSWNFSLFYSNAVALEKFSLHKLKGKLIKLLALIN